MKWTGENASPYALSMPWPMGAASAVLMLSLAACSGKSSNSKEPSNLDEAVAMYQELMEQENQIFAKNKKLRASRLWAVSHPTNRKKRRTT